MVWFSLRLEYLEDAWKLARICRWDGNHDDIFWRRIE